MYGLIVLRPDAGAAAKAARVAARYAVDAEDLRRLLGMLGIPTAPQPEPEPEQLPRLPCSYQSWSEFRRGSDGRRHHPYCRACGSAFKDWHRCHAQP